MTITITPPPGTLTGIEYGEFTPKQIAFRGTNWPVSRVGQHPEVFEYMEKALHDTQADPARGIKVRVHWNGRHNKDTWVQAVVRTYHADTDGSEFTGVCIDEFTLDGVPVGRSTIQQQRLDIKLLRLEYGIKAYDKPPQAPVKEKEES